MRGAVECRGLTKVFEYRVRRGTCIESPGDVIYLSLLTLFTSYWIRGERRRVVALSGVTFTAREGEVLGILGPNGSGKTTLLKIVSGFIYPTSGEVYVLGHDVFREVDAVRSKLLYVTSAHLGGFGFSPLFSVRKNLEYMFRLYRIPRDRVDEAIDRLGLKEYADKPLGYLSPGLASRVVLAPMFFVEQGVLLLDEPTQGLSPEAVRAIHEYVREIGGRGVTVLYATNRVYEAEAVCDRFIILHRGRLVASGRLEELVRRAALKSAVRVTLSSELSAEALAEALGPEFRVEERGGGRYVVTALTADPAEAISEVFDRLRGRGAVVSIKIDEPTLEDVFMHYVGGEVGEELEERGFCLVH